MRLLASLLVFAALLAAGEAGKAASQLEKALKSYDPSAWPKDRKVEAEWDEIKKKAMDEAAKKHAGAKNWADYAPQYWKDDLAKLKGRLQKEQIDEQNAALKALGAEDTRATLDDLCDLFGLVDERIVACEARQDEYQKAEMDAFRRNGSDPMQPDARYHVRDSLVVFEAQVYRELLRDYSDHLLGMRFEIAGHLRRRAGEADRALLEKQLANAKSAPLRIKLAEILSANDEADPEVFVAALRREKDAEAKAAMVAALGRLREKSRPQIALLAKVLQDNSERVRITTAFALSKIRAPEAVEPLIERMAKEEGRTRHDFANALRQLTGEKFGPFPDIWSQWWEGNKGRLLTEGLPVPGEDEDDDRDDRKGDGNFYGIPQISQRIIYVLDISGSMKHQVGDGTRLDACRAEFKRAVAALRPGATFNLIVYNKDARRWEEKRPMAAADDKARAAVGKFVDEFGPAQNTNIYDALRMAFDIIGEGATKKGVPLNADTIYLLTDGSPTKPEGTPDDTDKILEAARKWNPQGVVTIHTIGIGDNLNTPFLAQLAREHNGMFVHKNKD